MLFNYAAIDKEGNRQEGTIDAINEDVAIQSLQRRGLIISGIASAEKTSLLSMNMTFLERASTRDVVMLSRQIATLFKAQVSALKVFRMLGAESSKPFIARTLNEVSMDLQSGMTISGALGQHPKVFSPFYVNMVKSGEESGKLDETFNYLADYLDRNYELLAKVRGALTYPIFVVIVFIAVMLFMFTAIIPSITTILTESGQDIPIYTKVVIWISDLLVNYGLWVLIAGLIALFAGWQYGRTPDGKEMIAVLKLKLPLLGPLYRKLYLSRLADNMSTMLASGIPMVRVIEITADVLGNLIYKQILLDAAVDVKAGMAVSEALGQHDEIPSILVQMMRVGEETGELGQILDTLSAFYRREVQNDIDAIVDLIEPAMIVLLGGGVLILILSVLVPIYNLTGAF